MLPPLTKGTRAGDLHYIHSTVSKQIQLFSLLFSIIAWANSRISFKNSLHKRRERLNLSSESVSGLSLSVVSLQKDSAFTNAVIHWEQADKSNSTTRLYVATHSHTQMPGRTVAHMVALFLTLTQAHETGKDSTNKQKEQMQRSIWMPCAGQNQKWPPTLPFLSTEDYFDRLWCCAHADHNDSVYSR